MGQDLRQLRQRDEPDAVSAARRLERPQGRQRGPQDHLPLRRRQPAAKRDRAGPGRQGPTAATRPWSPPTVTIRPATSKPSPTPTATVSPAGPTAPKCRSPPATSTTPTATSPR